ncbi:MAG: hypothetical protein LWX55_07040, partial [Deltaproteobacteria bacterium]|nr:hypothetical protein [Deltaproteobacteria bacterium]
HENEFNRETQKAQPGSELALPTSDLFRCALIHVPEQIRWSESLSGLQAWGLSPPRLRSAPHYTIEIR